MSCGFSQFQFQPPTLYKSLYLGLVELPPLINNRLHVNHKGITIKVVNSKMYNIHINSRVDTAVFLGSDILEGAGIDILFSMINYVDFLIQTCGRINVINTEELCAIYNFDGVENAFWNGRYLICGNGAGEFKQFVSIDVIAHECTHGLVQTTCGLVYNAESGALNESFCDMFATACEYYMYKKYKNMEGTFDFFIGEDLMRQSIVETGTAEMPTQKRYVRNMVNPNECKQPMIYKGEYWCSGSNDNGGVHINSGVPNHLFYKLSLSIGVMETVELMYRTMKRLKNVSGFRDFADALLQVCNYEYYDIVKKCLSDIGL